MVTAVGQSVPNFQIRTFLPPHHLPSRKTERENASAPREPNHWTNFVQTKVCCSPKEQGRQEKEERTENPVPLV
jgi:hypothetical protein